MNSRESKNASFSINTDSKCDFILTITKFSSVKSDIICDEFSISPICSSKWKVIVRCFKINKEKQMSIGLQRLDNSNHAVEMDFEYSLRNSKQTLFFSESEKLAFQPNSDVIYFTTLDRPSSNHSVKTERGNFRLCMDDIFIVNGKLDLDPCCQHNEALKDNLVQLQRDIKATFINKDFSDVVFKIGNHPIPAHKFVLCTRSPVFKHMLESDMQEKTNNCIVICDTKKQDFEVFLKFLYTGILDKCDMGRTMALYSLADKYDVKCLRDTCSQVISENLEVENACIVLSLADFHSDEILKGIVVEYMTQNFSNIVPTDEWELLVDSNPGLASKMVRLASKKNS